MDSFLLQNTENSGILKARREDAHDQQRFLRFLKQKTEIAVAGFLKSSDYI